MKGLGIHIIQYPSGNWGFAGSVPVELALSGSKEDINDALRFGIGFSKAKTISFVSKKLAEKALSDYNKTT